MKNNIKDLSLKELREYYPSIKDTSKEGFLKKVEELRQHFSDINIDVEYIPSALPEVKELSLIDELLANNSIKKYLIVSPDTQMSDQNMYELFLELQKLQKESPAKIRSIMFQERMHELHINGEVYVKFTCVKNRNHWMSVQRFDSVIVL